jgi:transketolase
VSGEAIPMFSKAAEARARAMRLRLGRPNQEVFAEAVLAFAQSDQRLLVVTSDSRGSGKLVPFAAALPNQIIEVGIAEQNLVGVAAGLASAGFKVFAISPACFLTARALEQIKNDVAYSDHPVVLVGISAGVSYGALGSTHHSLHDVAVLRAINNVEVIVPADNQETSDAIVYAVSARHPVYLRLGKAPVYSMPTGTGNGPFGAPRVVRGGCQLAFVATGETVVHALLAAGELEDRFGISCRVISVPKLNPLEKTAILDAARECGAVVTVEEHMVHGGLGEACAAALMQAGVHCEFKIVGIPNEYTVTGSQADIFRHYGITMEGLVDTANALLKRGL